MVQLHHPTQETMPSPQEKLAALMGGAAPTKKKVGKRTMSAETIEKMRASQQARWVKKKGAAAK